MEVCYTLSFVLIFFNIVYAKLYYINEVCKFKTSTSLYCEWVNEGIYVLREQSPNYNYVEHIEFDRLQNSIVDANGFKKLKTISFPMSQFDTTRQLCDHIRRQRQRVTLYEGTISVSCDPEITEHTKDSYTFMIQTDTTTPKPVRETTSLTSATMMRHVANTTATMMRHVVDTTATMMRHVEDTTSGSQHMSESTAFIQDIKSGTTTPSYLESSTHSIKTNNALQTTASIMGTIIALLVIIIIIIIIFALRACAHARRQQAPLSSPLSPIYSTTTSPLSPTPLLETSTTSPISPSSVLETSMSEPAILQLADEQPISSRTRMRCKQQLPF